MTVSLPPKMAEEVDRVRKAEHRTRSELVREALRTYFAVARGLSVYTPTARELRAIEKGRKEMARGESLTLNDLFGDVGSSRRKARAKSRRARS